MRAVHLVACGEAPVAVDVEEPTPAPGQALVAVAAAPITPLDLLVASGTSYFGRPATPYVPGVQGVGTVVSSDRLPVGARVWFPTRAGIVPAGAAQGDGAMAERVVVDDADVVELTGDVPAAHLAALGLSAVAAWCSLLTRGGLRPGERVLVLGATGVVGRVAVQVARLSGAAEVYAAATSPDGSAVAAEIGADDFVALSRTDTDPEAVAARMRGVVGEVDLVLDPLGGVPATAALTCLAPRGRLVHLGSSAGPTATFSSAHLRSGSRSILGYTNADLTPQEQAEALRAVEQHAAAARLAVPYETFTPDRAGEAWRRQAVGEVDGRAVVVFSGLSGSW